MMARHTISLVIVVSMWKLVILWMSFLLFTLIVMKYMTTFSKVKNNIMNGHNDVIICGINCLSAKVSAVAKATTHNNETKNIECLDFIIS